MPANIATTNGRPALAYYGEAPWHRLGTPLDHPATAAEAITAAGLDYEVELAAMTTATGLPVPKSRAVVRADSATVLGVVGERYVPVQNRQAFGFLDAVAAGGGLRYHTAGALGRGEKIWLLAKLPGHLRVRDTDDLVDKYLLLSNAHDGSAALRAFFTPVRVVCRNTLTIAHAAARGQGVRVRHNGDLAGKIRDAQRVLGLARRFFDDAAAVIDRLAGSYPTGAQLVSYFEALYPDPPEGADNARAAGRGLAGLPRDGVYDPQGGQNVAGFGLFASGDDRFGGIDRREWWHPRVAIGLRLADESLERQRTVGGRPGRASG